MVENVEESELKDDGEKVDGHKGKVDDEGQVPNILSCPAQPTKEERPGHNCTHIPYRAWCDHCVPREIKRRTTNKKEREREREIEREHKKETEGATLKQCGA